MTAQEWAVRIFSQAKENFRVIDLPEESIAYFAKEAAKNDVGCLLMRRREIFKLEDPELFESFWNEVSSWISEIKT